MSKTLTQMPQRGLFCTVPVGLAGSGSIDMLGAPAADEAMLLVVALGMFLATGYGIFRAWGKPAAQRPASAQGTAPALAG